MGKKQYEFAATLIRELRASKDSDKHDYLGSFYLESCFVEFFKKFDTRGVFQEGRFVDACKPKNKPHK